MLSLLPHHHRHRRLVMMCRCWPPLPLLPKSLPCTAPTEPPPLLVVVVPVPPLSVIASTPRKTPAAAAAAVTSALEAQLLPMKLDESEPRRHFVHPGSPTELPEKLWGGNKRRGSGELLFKRGSAVHVACGV